MKRKPTTDIFIAVNPVGSKFAKALQQGLRDVGITSLRCSLGRAVDHRRRGRKVFTVTPVTRNKIEQFQAFTRDGVSCPAFCTSPDGVAQLPSTTVFARTLINSTGGKGIVEFEKQGTVVPRAPLYTAYVPKKAEYRVHVFAGKVIDVQQKRKKREFEAAARDTRIRNLANGYVYTRESLVEPVGLRELAIKAVNSVGYAYGAVDIIYNEKNNTCYVLEVNSRAGLMGTTLVNYANAVKGLFV